ncbi:MAG: SDR family oxidoreductase [Pseudomonadota bacterium]|nr:SDR family oxidoreductase [Pseudomonadota bacterium]
MWTLITGASSGIGRALALELGQQGHDLLLSGRDKKRLTDVAEAIRERSPGVRAEMLPADLSDPGSTRDLAEQVGELVDRLDTFVYCAGIGEPAPDFASMGLIDFQEALAVNVSAPMMLSQKLLPRMRGGEPASRIVMVGAGMDKQAQPGTGSYGISKMALRRLVRQMAVEFDTLADGPVVSLFQPGLVDTPGIRRHIAKAENLDLPHAKWLAGRLEAGECLTAEQAASALAFTLRQVPESDFHGAVFNGRDLVDSLSFAAS